MAEFPVYVPRMTDAGLSPTHGVRVMDEFGATREVQIAGERPLTIHVDGREIVTLMTLGNFPEALVLGYLRSQRFIEDLREVLEVQVDWQRERAEVGTRNGIDGWDEKLKRRIVTTGCGQGTVFSCTIDKLYTQRLPEVRLYQSTLYGLLDALSHHNAIYRRAGAVHGCALCRGTEILSFVEDVGRHNAADTIAGQMWLGAEPGGDKVFYTTGRLTSEIVMKVAGMGIPAVVSRSGITQMGLELARELGVLMIARAKGRHFFVYAGADRVVLDQIPPQPPGRRPSKPD